MGTIDGPISVPALALPFEDLARLRTLSREIGTKAVESLANYRDDESGGYLHALKEDAAKPSGEFSYSSTATVVTFLVRSGRWKASMGGEEAKAAVVAQHLVDKIVKSNWESAELDPDNVFTVAFLLELVAELRMEEAKLTDDQARVCRDKLKILVEALDHEDAAGKKKHPGRVSLRGEVPNSYLTDLASRVVRHWAGRWPNEKWPEIDEAVEKKIWQGAIDALNSEMARLAGDRGSADPFEIGYSIILAVEFAGRVAAERVRPDERRLLRDGLMAFFGLQHADGSWPRSRRLFSYPKYGDAYCYEFEFLARLLRAFTEPGRTLNQKALLPHLDALQRSITRLTQEAVSLPGGGYGWASGHHRALVYPESWSTASAFDVCDLIDRLATDTITTTVLQHLGHKRLAPDQVLKPGSFKDLLDSYIPEGDEKRVSLKRVIKSRLLVPIAVQKKRLQEGKELDKGTALSAILYGPPGTSKTTYAKAIAQYLGWDEIIVDPSHLLHGGIDNIHAEIDALFRMLVEAERVVVFFDEIDELVRERSDLSTRELSRFLTTSMLPRIVNLRTSRKLVYLVATNHLETFDQAITRPGRFDLVLPVWPPTAQEKFRMWPEVKVAFERLGAGSDPALVSLLGGLTFDESLSVKEMLASASTRDILAKTLADACSTSILEQPEKKGRTWRQLMDSEVGRARTGPRWPRPEWLIRERRLDHVPLGAAND